MKYEDEETFAREILKFHDIALSAQTISQERVELLEAILLAKPDDVLCRVQLIGFYASQAYHNASFDEKRVRHILWFISNLPDHPIVGVRWTAIPKVFLPEFYLEGKKAWMSELAKPSVNDISKRNAVHYFVGNESKLALKILLEFKSTDSSNKWDDEITFVEDFIRRFPSELE